MQCCNMMLSLPFFDFYHIKKKKKELVEVLERGLAKKQVVNLYFPWKVLSAGRG